MTIYNVILSKTNLKWETGSILQRQKKGTLGYADDSTGIPRSVEIRYSHSRWPRFDELGLKADADWSAANFVKLNA